MSEPSAIPYEAPLPPAAPPKCPECGTIVGSYPASRRDGLEYRCPEHGVVNAITQLGTWSVTVEAFGQTRTRTVQAYSQRAAEDEVIASTGFRVTTREVER